MNTTIVYPYPLVSGDDGTPEDARSVFRPFAVRFASTLHRYPPSPDVELVVVFGGDSYTKRDTDNFPSGTRHALYGGRGIDIGSTQYAVKHYLVCDGFIIGCTSRVYFHRPGAVQRLIDARQKYGRGLYGAVGSFEQCPLVQDRFPNPHLRTVWYGMDAEDWLRYPFDVNSRTDAHHFEAGNWNVMQWFLDRGLPVKMVTWDKEYDPKDFRHPEIRNAFRRGDQSDMLVWDKHSDIYRDASLDYKKVLADCADGIKKP